MSVNRIHTRSQGKSTKTSAGSHWSSAHTGLIIKAANHRLTDRAAMLISHIFAYYLRFAFITTHMRLNIKFY